MATSPEKKKPLPLTRFTARIELPDIPHGDYEELHADMKAAGYSRIITLGDGKAYHLPHATYTRQIRGGGLEAVRDSIVVIAKRSHPKPRVLLIQGRAAICGLKPVALTSPDPDAD